MASAPARSLRAVRSAALRTSPALPSVASAPPRSARQLYRGRFGSETSYRCAGRVRGWTTSRNPAYRFILIALAFVLLNVWIHLRWIFTQVSSHGRRCLDTTRFPLTRFALFIRRTLEYLYGCLQLVTAPAMPRS